MKSQKKSQKKTDADLAAFIKKGLDHCSLENYLGDHLPPGKHTTLANSAVNGKTFEKQLKQEKKEIKQLLKEIQKTCRIDMYKKSFILKDRYAPVV